MRPVLTFSAALAMISQPVYAELKDVALGHRYELAPYGHLHGAYQSFDDGQQVTGTIVDPGTSISRIGFYIQPKSAELGLSFQFETSLGFRPSNKVSQLDTPPAWDWTKGNLRQVQVIYTAGFGTFRLGQGSMPMDSATETDENGFNTVAKSNISEGYGDYLFRDSTGDLTGISVGNTFGNFDGSRRMRVRFDTKSIGGFSLAVGYGIEVLKENDDNTYYDVALRYKNEFGRLKLNAAFGNAWVNTDTTTNRTTAGSISILDTDTGLSFTVAGGQASDAAKANYVYLRAGWGQNIWEIGKTKVAIEYYAGSDFETLGSSSNMWGVAVIQDVERLDLQVYAGYREFKYSDLTSTTYQDAQGIQIGAKWKF